MVDISWVTDQIAVSGAFLEEDIPYLKDEGIEVIVDMRSEACDNKELIEEFGMQFFHVEVNDCTSPTSRQLDGIFNFVEPFLEAGKKILVHCQNGFGRSPLVVVAILAKRGMDISNAVSLVENRHPGMGLTNNQQNFIYIELEKILNSD